MRKRETSEMVRKLLMIIVLAICFQGVSNAAYAQDGISVFIDGEKINFDVQPQIMDYRTMVPMRIIFESLGAVVYWNDDTRTVTAIKNLTTVETTIGDKTMYVNGEKILIDVAPSIVEDRTLVPVRFVSEALGGEVDWDEALQRVNITTEVGYDFPYDDTIDFQK